MTGKTGVLEEIQWRQQRNVKEQEPEWLQQSATKT